MIRSLLIVFFLILILAGCAGSYPQQEQIAVEMVPGAFEEKADMPEPTVTNAKKPTTANIEEKADTKTEKTVNDRNTACYISSP